jgi:hypothetical protein
MANQARFGRAHGAAGAVTETLRIADAGHRRFADPYAVALADQDLVSCRHIEIDPGAELDDAHELAALTPVSLAEIRDHPARDQAGELADADAVAVRPQKDVGVALVLVADVGAVGGELLAAEKRREDDFACHRAALDMHVENRQEGHDSPVWTRADLRIDDLLDRRDETVGSGEHDALRPVVVAPRVAEEQQDEETQQREGDRGDAALEKEQSRRDRHQRQDEGPGLLGETHPRRTRGGRELRAVGLRRRPGFPDARASSLPSGP